MSIFEVLTAKRTEAQVFKQPPPCRLVNRYRRFGGCCAYHTARLLATLYHFTVIDRLYIDKGNRKDKTRNML